MMYRSKTILVILLALLMGLMAACDADSPAEPGGQTDGGITRPNNAIEVSIVYSPESEMYMPDVIRDFNQSFANGINPVTGNALASGERPIFVTGGPGSSGTVMQGIVNAIIAPNNANVERPTMFMPSVSHWLALANFQSGRQLFDMSDIQATALAPVVMAIWESRLEAIREVSGTQDVGWEELLQVLNSENGWQDYGFSGRKTVYYGHTDPYISSTALSTLIAEFYAAAAQDGFTGRRLGLEQVNDPNVQQGVRDIEQLIRHYSSRTTEFKEYIAQGPDYLDFVALEENDLIYINQGKTDIQPPEQLVALYPKEGTFWHEHPVGILNADWTTQEQREASRVFIDYLITPAIQEIVMEHGFRPVNPDVELGYPFVPENGVTAEGPTNVLNVPAPEVISAIQQSWAFVKKQADILVLIDISGSMSGDRIEQAQEAAITFINNMESTNRVGLSVFNERLEERIPLGHLESNKDRLISSIRSLRVSGGTAMYDSIYQVVRQMNEEDDSDRIRAIIILSDGEDTSQGGRTLNDVINSIQASRETMNPVIVIPVAYGSNADINALNSIARASSTRVQSGDPENILNILEIISSYF